LDRQTEDEIFQLHAGLCKALSETKRLLLIEALREGPATVSDLAEQLGLSQPNTSQHLAVLRERGIVWAERSGSNVFYSLRNPKVLRALDLLREVMTEHLADQDRLHKAAQQTS
jgi:ArsR family transcriptional regulator, virulence genes transcriptional regulator